MSDGALNGARARARAWPAIALCAAILAPATLAAAGPWTPAPGEGYAKIWAKWLPGFGYHTGDGRNEPYGGYHELSVTAYSELGLRDGLALVAHLPLFNVFALEDPRPGTTSSHVSTSHISLGDPTLAMRVRLVKQAGFVLSVEGSVRAPLASGDEKQTVYGTAAGNPVLGALRVGNGVWDFGAVVALGYAWSRAYMAASAGYIYRTGNYDGVVMWTAEGGGQVTERVALRLRLTRLHAVQDGSAPRSESPSGIGNGTSYLGFSFEADRRFGDRWFLGGALEGGLAFIRRQSGGPVISLYVATRF